MHTALNVHLSTTAPAERPAITVEPSHIHITRPRRTAAPTVDAAVPAPSC